RVVAAEHVSAAGTGKDLVYLVPVGQHRSAGVAAVVAGHGVPAALHVDPGVGEVLPGDTPAVEGVAGHDAVHRALLDVDLLGRHVRPEVVVQDLVAVAAIRTCTGVLAVLRPVALRGTEVQPFAEPGRRQPGVVHRGVLQHVVRAGRAEVHALVADAVHLQTVEDVVGGPVEHDALVRAGDREAGQAPVRDPVEVQPEPAVGDPARRGRYVRVAASMGVGQCGAGRTGQRDRRARRTAGGGVEGDVVDTGGQADRVTGPGGGERCGQLCRGGHRYRPAARTGRRRAQRGRRRRCAGPARTGGRC